MTQQKRRLELPPLQFLSALPLLLPRRLQTISRRQKQTDSRHWYLSRMSLPLRQMQQHSRLIRLHHCLPLMQPRHSRLYLQHCQHQQSTTRKMGQERQQ